MIAPSHPSPLPPPQQGGEKLVLDLFADWVERWKVRAESRRASPLHALSSAPKSTPLPVCFCAMQTGVVKLTPAVRLCPCSRLRQERNEASANLSPRLFTVGRLVRVKSRFLGLPFAKIASTRPPRCVLGSPESADSCVAACHAMLLYRPCLPRSFFQDVGTSGLIFVTNDGDW